ncbi:MAG TPA: SpoIIE family protein phosphatase [Thermoanaerobaculia bacterium]|nr:SpoIIE family protein phosphatase [Thermoanaerobaculia bacterium]
MALRKSTRIWLALFAVGLAGILVNGSSDRLGSASILFTLLADTAACVLLWRAGVAAFRLIIRRLTLRLAFSYFLIGIVPIPLLAALFSVAGYVLAHQIIATRLRDEVNELADLARSSAADAPHVQLGRDGRVVSSDVSWLKPGDEVPWAGALVLPHPIIVQGSVWIGIRNETPGGPVLRLLPLQDPSAPWLQRLADRTGWDVMVRAGSGEGTFSGYQIRVRRNRERKAEERFVSPHPSAEPIPRTFWSREWLGGIYVDRAVAIVGEKPAGTPVVAFLARTSPAVFLGQLFAQGVPEIRRIVRVLIVGLTAALLLVYLVALAIAFGLVASIVRNVNRLTRATAAISAGDFSVRVNSKSKDQIGDLARSFDGMAASIQSLLRETARKEKLEADLAVARAIQESFLPESGVRWKGFHAVAHFEPAADLGGDYYDILPMPDGRTAVAIGDVSGHGLPTGLVAAAARASLASFVELGVPADQAFLRLGQRTERSRDSQRRLYTTLSFFAYDAGRRVGTLTNAGHPAPYRVSGNRVERLEVSALPIGLLPGKPSSYPSKDFAFDPGDRLVFFTDGVVEAADAQEDPWGYERLEALLAREGELPPDQLVGAVLAAVAAHVGPTPLEDDRTLLILSFDAA